MPCQRSIGPYKMVRRGGIILISFLNDSNLHLEEARWRHRDRYEDRAGCSQGNRMQIWEALFNQRLASPPSTDTERKVEGREGKGRGKGCAKKGGNREGHGEQKEIKRIDKEKEAGKKKGEKRDRKREG